jgi:hypothetical protein
METQPPPNKTPEESVFVRSEYLATVIEAAQWLVEEHQVDFKDAVCEIYEFERSWEEINVDLDPLLDDASVSKHNPLLSQSQYLEKAVGDAEWLVQKTGAEFEHAFDVILRIQLAWENATHADPDEPVRAFSVMSFPRSEE